VERPIIQPLALAKPDLRQFGGVRLAEGFDLDRVLTDFGLMSVFAEHILHESSDITRHIGPPLAKISSNLIPAYDFFRLDARQAAQPRKPETSHLRAAPFLFVEVLLDTDVIERFAKSIQRAPEVLEC
jgi:hypothetical protein